MSLINLRKSLNSYEKNNFQITLIDIIFRTNIKSSISSIPNTISAEDTISLVSQPSELILSQSLLTIIFWNDDHHYVSRLNPLYTPISSRHPFRKTVKLISYFRLLLISSFVCLHLLLKRMKWRFFIRSENWNRYFCMPFHSL